MLSKEKLERINELAKKKKREGLTKEEAQEQSRLRGEYLAAFRASFKSTIENVTVIDPNGNDVTPDRIKMIKSQKKLH